LKIFFGRRSLTWIYIVAKGFYIFIIRTNFIHYRLLQHTRHLKELLAKVFIQSSCNAKLLSMPALLSRLSLLKSVFALMQAVREVYEVVPAREWSDTQSRTNKIVFIGMFTNVTVVNHPLLTSYESDPESSRAYFATGRDLDISILQDSFSRCKH
jgi:hypothetical protein